MTKPIMIKTLCLGDGQPKICVPLTGGTAEELFQEAEKIKEAGILAFFIRYGDEN